MTDKKDGPTLKPIQPEEVGIWCSLELEAKKNITGIKERLKKKITLPSNASAEMQARLATTERSLSASQEQKALFFACEV